MPLRALAHLLSRPLLGLLLAPLAAWVGWLALEEGRAYGRMPAEPAAQTLRSAAALVAAHGPGRVTVVDLILDCSRIYRGRQGEAWVPARSPEQPLVVVTLAPTVRCSTLVGEPFTGLLSPMPAEVVRMLGRSGLSRLDHSPSALLLCTTCPRWHALVRAVLLGLLALALLAVPLLLRSLAPRLLPLLRPRPSGLDESPEPPEPTGPDAPDPPVPPRQP